MRVVDYRGKIPRGTGSLQLHEITCAEGWFFTPEFYENPTCRILNEEVSFLPVVVGHDAPDPDRILARSLVRRGYESAPRVSGVGHYLYNRRAAGRAPDLLRTFL